MAIDINNGLPLQKHFIVVQIGEKAQFLRKNGTFLKNPIWRTKTKNVINVCMHKFACTNVTSKGRNEAHFTNHVPYCAWVKKCLGILVPRAHDPSDLRQGSRALAGLDFLSKRRVIVPYSQPIRFARFEGKSVNRGLPELDKARALGPCRRSEVRGLWGREWCLGKK